MSELKLYEHELSGNAYKVRLFLSLLGLPFTAERVDLFKGAGQHPDYLAISAMGQVPALVDGGNAIRDSTVAGSPTIRSARRERSPGFPSPPTSWRTGPRRCASRRGSSAPSTSSGRPP
jgi:hypothetical protein